MRATEQNLFATDVVLIQDVLIQDVLNSLLALPTNFTSSAGGAFISVLCMDAVSRPCAAGLSSGFRVLVLVVLDIVVVRLLVAVSVAVVLNVVEMVYVLLMVTVLVVLVVFVVIVVIALDVDFVAVVLALNVVVTAMVALASVALVPALMACGTRVAFDLLENDGLLCAMMPLSDPPSALEEALRCALLPVEEVLPDSATTALVVAAVEVEPPVVVVLRPGGSGKASSTLANAHRNGSNSSSQATVVGLAWWQRSMGVQ